MNERILELSYEAQRYALNNTTGPDLAGLNELWQEKFAELVVKECLSYAKDGDLDFMKFMIKKNFGVEE